MKSQKISHGRLNNFKKRYRITLQTIAGELGSVYKVKIEEDRKRKLLNEKKTPVEIEEELEISTENEQKQNQPMKSCMID